jgi:hypothetical protein
MEDALFYMLAVFAILWAFVTFAWKVNSPPPRSSAARRSRESRSSTASRPSFASRPAEAPYIRMPGRTEFSHTD